MAACDEVEEVLLEVGSGAGNSVDFVLPNHFRERNAQLSGTHCPGERNHHFPAEVLLKVGSGAGNSVDFVLPNHFRERNAQLSGTHCPGERNHHFPASLKMCGISVGGIF